MASCGSLIRGNLYISLSFPTPFSLGILKFYGHISRSKELDFLQLNRQYPEFLKSFLSACLSPEDDTQWGRAVDTLGVLGSTLIGRAALETCGSLAREAVKALGGIMARGHSNLRVRVLDSLAIFFSCPEGREVEGWTSEQWFHHLHASPLTLVMSIIKQPFDDLRTAGFRFLLSVAPREWGQREMSGHPGLLEYLLDRRATLNKAGKELKFDIIHALVTSGTAEAVFGSPNFLKLRLYDREGPFFVTGDQAVAMGDSAQ